MARGVVVLWSGNRPRLAAHEIPAGGSLDLNRSTVAPDDDQVSNTHATIAGRGQLQVFDLGSRNGTYINGIQLHPVIGADNSGLIAPPTLVRIGRTLLLVVDDITPYLGRTMTTRHRLPVGASLHVPCNDVDRAILDESSVGIVGPRWVTRALGRSYVAALGGGPEIDASRASAISLEAQLGGAGRKVAMLIAPGALLQPDLRTLRTWLETDTRFVTCARRERELDALPREILHWLVPKRIVIPEPRYDELPTVIHSSVANAAPGMEIHITAIEEVLLEARRRGEDELLRRIGDRVRDLIARRSNVLRGDNLFRPQAPAAGDEATYVQFRVPSYPIDDD